MSAGTKIEWTDHTFNPWWGCERVSPACDHCYAETTARRYGHDVWGKSADRRFFGDKHWAEPHKWNRAAAAAGTRARVFCASMADVFEARDDLNTERQRLWDLIEATPHLDWLLLTKRPQNVARIIPWGATWPTNVWLGTTVENQRYADLRIPQLLVNPAHVHFLSIEPLLGPIGLADHFGYEWIGSGGQRQFLPPKERRVDWVIVGGESGPGARPMDPAWARDLRDQCVAAGVAFFFKQWGEWVPRELAYQIIGDDAVRAARRSSYDVIGDEFVHRVGKKLAGRVLDGRTWDEYPE